ncbi:MAG: YfhO family protein [Clostridia bacterium]|nr:YfhO family protein [Clostridia bacterium]
MDSTNQTPATREVPAILKNGMLKKQPRWRTFLDKTFGEYGYLLFAALIPMVLFYLMYLITQQLYPFGDGTVLVLDLNGQYVSFYEGLHDILRGEADLLYSFSRNLGGEFLGIYDYYVASPFAMLLALFPERFMLEALLILFLIKAGLCGLFMGIYLHKHAAGEPNRLVIVTFSVMYAMSSYCVVQQHNSMWIDAVMWLPMLCLGIESLIKYGRFRLYVFALAITIHSNFYIGYMAVIFTVAYCFYWYFAHNQNNENNPLGEKAHFIKSVGRVAVWSVLAVGIAALAILSARYALSFGKDEFSNPNWEVTQKFDLFNFFYKLLPSSYDTVRPQGLPFVYCGVLTLIAVPAFFMSKKFSLREKVAAALLILFFVASFATSSIDLIWHGFQKPNWLNYRYSFMLSFFLLVLAYRAFDQILYTSRKALLGTVIAIGAYTVILQKFTDFLVEEEEKMVIRPFATIWLTLGCLFAYFVLISLYGKVKERQKETVAMVLLFLVCVEFFLSGSSDMHQLDQDVTFSKYSRYNSMIDTVRPITDTIHEYDGGFYRMEKTYFRKTNDNFALGIKGLSCSTSTLNRDTIDFLRSMGYASRSHWSRYLGGTPVNDSLLGIKYLITNEDESDYYGPALFTPEDYGYDEDFSPNGQYDVYFNEFALSFAYGVADGWLTFDYEAYDNPYDRLNAMITVMLGETETVEVFKPATQNGDPETVNVNVGTAAGHDSFKVDDKTKAGILYYDYTVPTDTELFFFYPNEYLREVKLSVNDKAGGQGNSYTGKGTFGGGETNRIVSLGESTTGKLYLKVEIDNDSNNLYVIPKDSYIYYIDMETFKDAFTRLGQTQFIIDDTSTDSHLTGSVTTSSDRQLMFTSIPYDEGWNIYVDGEKVELYEANNSLISFYVEGSGEHSIEMKYMPATVALGIGVSVICLVIYILILIAYPFVKKVPYLRKLVMIEGEELPELATAEYRAEIAEGDVGAPDGERDIRAEAEAAKYGKVRPTTPEKKPDRSGKAPQGKPNGGHKGGKK